MSACTGGGGEGGDASATDVVEDSGADAVADAVPDGLAETADSTPPATPYRPEPGVSWQWQLSGTLDPSVDVAIYDVDLADTPAATIASLRAAGRKVLCYFSAGSYEAWRADAGAFAASDVGEALDGWPGEAWLDVRSASVRAIMAARLDVAVAKGCDGVEPDNVDGAFNATGFSLTEADTLSYLRFLSQEAHARGLSVGLKNTGDLVPAVEPDFDWALTEECLNYDECDAYAPFLAHGKAVFHTEYVDAPEQGPALAQTVCADARRAGLSTLIKTWELDAWRLACP